MLKTALILAACGGLYFGTPITFYQEEIKSQIVAGNIGVTPSANGTWREVVVDGTAPVSHVQTLNGVVPNMVDHRATISDLTIYCINSSALTGWWLRDGNTQNILACGRIFSGDPNVDYHFSTPISLSFGPLKPTIEFGSIATSGQPPFFPNAGGVGLSRVVISIGGRYVHDHP